MKTLLITALLLSGCGTLTTIPIDSTLISKEKATVIIYTEQDLAGHDMPLTIDKKIIGEIFSKSPMVIEVSPGVHQLYIGNWNFAFIRPITTANFEAGKVYYFKVWTEFANLGVALIAFKPENYKHIDQVNKTDSYQRNSSSKTIFN